MYTNLSSHVSTYAWNTDTFQRYGTVSHAGFSSELLRKSAVKPTTSRACEASSCFNHRIYVNLCRSFGRFGITWMESADQLVIKGFMHVGAWVTNLNLLLHWSWRPASLIQALQYLRQISAIQALHWSWLDQQCTLQHECYVWCLHWSVITTPELQNR
jgi:hypothetical protein